MCRCGCRGYCTLFEVFSMLSWSLQHLADKQFPTSRHDGSPWLASDEHRAAQSGEELPMRAVVLFVKGDWSEFATTIGLPSWADGYRPCFLYSCTRERMQELREAS